MVSFDRPFDEQFGAGLFFRLDFPLIVWLEDHGYSPDYISDVDLARDPGLLRDVQTLVFSGHSEYWTRRAMQRVRDAFGDLDRSTQAQIRSARELPAELRKDLIQSSDAAYPAGYEALLKSYYKALSTAEK